MNYLVSIIIPAYNVENYIDECIESCVNQSYTNLEIVVCDDGSTDSTLEKLEQWKKKDSRIVLLSQNNSGMSCARNIAIKKANGDAIVFVDSDDVLDKNVIYKLVNKWDGRISTIVGSNYIRFGKNIPNNNNESSYTKISKDKFFEKRQGYYCVSILFSRELLNNLGIIFNKDMRNLEDVVWMSEVMLYVDKVLYYNAPLYFYRITPDSATSKAVNAKWQVGCWIIATCNILEFRNSNTLTNKQVKELKKRIRMCKNNIYGELITKS